MTNSTFVERRRLRARRALFTLSTILCSGLAAPAFADSPHPNRDANGVDLTDGTFNLRLPIASIGSGQAELPLVAYSGTTDNWTQAYAIQTVSGNDYTVRVVLGDSYDDFVVPSGDGTVASSRGTGATVTMSGGLLESYSSLDGTQITFTGEEDPDHTTNLCGSLNTTNCTMLANTISGRSGLAASYNWTLHRNCASVLNPDGSVNCNVAWRLAGISNSAGYAITWAFVSDSVAAHTNPAAAWYQRTTATLTNAAVSMANPPIVSYATPSAGVTVITTPAGKAWRITANGTRVTGVRRPSASSDTLTVSGTNGAVTSVTNNGITTGYNRSVSGTTATMIVTDAQSYQTTIVSDMGKYRPVSVTDPLGRVTNLVYDTLGRPTEITYPEGNKVQYAYDGRGNVTTTTVKAKAGAGLSDIVSTAIYPSTCSDASCNEPSATIDARGNQTDYTYDATTGLLAKVTAPAPSNGAPRLETRYSYSTIGGVAVVTGVSTCRTGSAPSCIGTADEVKTSISYDSNLNLVSATNGAGDSSLAATTARTYDAIGNLLTVDGPLAGTADTTSFRYDADRARVGIISPDPDGAGALKRRAIRQSYNSDGQPTVTEAGTVNGTGDSDWAAFASLQQSVASYDGNARKTQDVATAGGTTYSVVQYSYDAVGRPECTALRMNSAAWGSLPSSACTLGAVGAFGPDRITKTIYDAAGQVTKTQSAYGTADQADDATATYTGNGALATLTDAQNNRTSYGYDGFDRRVVTYYPSTTAGSGASSATDYEQLGYDANGNVTSRRLRDGQTIAFRYDALNRRTYKDLPTGENDVSYSYDLLNRPVLVSRPDGVTDTLAYDALGRVTSDSQAFGSIAWQYDLAGRRTQTRWNDGFFVAYDYLVTGEVSAVRENGATSGIGVLARYSYDDLGRRTGITRGNGTSSGYGYDAASRLASLTQDVAGASYDLTLGFGYNPAGQIASLTRSNDGYAWGGAVNRNDASGVNGLNQITTVGAGNLGYDGRGNLASTGSTTFGYTSENRLAATNTGVSLYYDGLGRLTEYDTSVSTRFAYDGNQIATEIANPSGTILKRYVYGPGNDEPLVEYDLSGGGYTRSWLHADERGSLIAQTNDGGAVTAVNSYDEYGVPGAGNVGRFGYTGQAYLPELGLWYYKARMYSSRLGRFLQTDPIGYGDGLNWYNYVGGDPVNGIDPTGLETASTCTGSRIPANCGPGGGVARFQLNALPPSFAGGGTIILPGVICSGGGPSRTNSSGDIIVTAVICQATYTITPNYGTGSSANLLLGGPVASAPGSVSALQKPKQPASVTRNRKACELLLNNNFSTYDAWQAALALRNPDGPSNNWSDGNLRNVENMLYEAYAGESSFNIWLHQNSKGIRRAFGIRTSPYSADALQAGYDGEKLYGMTKNQLAEWCNDTAG